jgi:hypothetical protein
MSASGRRRRHLLGQSIPGCDPKAKWRVTYDFIRECEHRGRDVEPRALAVASGDKDVAFRQQFQ